MPRFTRFLRRLLACGLVAGLALLSWGPAARVGRPLAVIGPVLGIAPGDYVTQAGLALVLPGLSHPAASRGHVPAAAFESFRTAVFN